MIGRFYQAIDGNRGFSIGTPAGTEPGFPNSPIFPENLHILARGPHFVL
jgi:hypothetical protein